MKRNLLITKRRLNLTLTGLVLLGAAGAAQAQAPTFAAFTQYGTAGTGGVGGVTLRDLNGDGRPDVVASNISSGTVAILLGQAGGTLGTAATFSSGGTQPYRTAVGDVNADGRLDIVVGNFNSNTIGVLLGLAGGTFGAPVTYTTGGTGTFDVVLNDVNADGRLDIITSNSSSGTVGVLLGQAGGTFGAATTYAVGGSQPYYVALADVNTDGRLDIAVANYGNSTVAVLLGQAGGTFGTATTYGSGGQSFGMTLGDVNADGRPDIVTSNLNMNSAGVLLGQAGGTFGAVTTYGVGGSAYGVALGDLNGDARPDIVTGNFNSNTAAVLTGQAGGTFAAALQFGTGSASPYSEALGDLNGDGRLDIVVGNNGGNTVSVLLNTGTFTTGDLVVNTGTAASPVSIPAGTYNSITVTGSGYGVLAGNVTVNSAVTVQSGGQLNDGCFVIGGPGTFTLAAGGALGICSPQGIAASGATGAVQVTGARTFSNDASYLYNGTAAQVTGAGLPSQVRSLGTVNSAAVTLSAPVSVVQAVGVDAGNLVLNGQALTLLSTAAGTALVVNNGAGVVSGTATVQRFLDPSQNAGLGYRHLSAPVNNTTVADLATGAFTPEVSQASTYNASATPGTTTPFPTVFGYDQSRVNLVNSFAPFDRGFFVPASTASPLVVGRGYAVNLPASALVDFVGTLNNGAQSVALTRNAAGSANEFDAGWQLVGNPYPSPLDASLIAAADRTGLDAASYVFESSSQYAGSYRAFVNGVGGNPLVGMAQGLFVRVSTGQPSATLTFRNAQRVTSFGTQVPVRRGAADLRPLVQLELRGATGAADALYAYAQAGATASADAAFDAVKRLNSTGLNLASVAGNGEALAIDGRPAFTAGTVLPLSVGVPAAGAYSLTAAALHNLPAGLDALLTDAQTGQTVNLRTQPAYTFTVSAAEAATAVTGRFALAFAARTALSNASALSAAEVSLFPNPSQGNFTVLMPAVAKATTVHAELLNTLGQVVRHQEVALPKGGTQLSVNATGLAAGVYTLRLQAGSATVSKRVILN